MTNKKSFILYCDLCKVFSELTDEQAGQLIKEIANYAESITHNNPPKPTGLSGLLNAIATPFKNHIDRDFERWLRKRAANIENGKKGGRAKKPKTQKNPNEGVTVTVTDTDTVIHSKNSPPEKIEQEYHQAGRVKGLSEKQIDSLYEKFYHYYSAKNNKDIADWLSMWKAWISDKEPEKKDSKKPEPARNNPYVVDITTLTDEEKEARGIWVAPKKK